MLKALRYLRPFKFAVAAIILLVFAQVQFELALPDYMSAIVTYGIQYSGITDPVPEHLSESTYEHMKLFMDAADAAVLEENYTKNGAVYDRISSPSAELASVTEKPFLIVSMLKSEEVASQIGIDPEALYAMIEAQPEAAAAVMAKMEEQTAGYTADNLRAAQIMMLKGEYTSIGIDMEKKQTAYILHEGLLMLGIALMGSLCAAASAFLASRTATGACRNMRADVFRTVESFSSEEFSKFSTASLITRTTNDIQQVQMVITMLLRIVLFAPFMGLTSLVKVLRYRSLASILGWAVAFMIAVMIVILTFTMPKFKQAQKMVDSLNLVTREQLSGMLVIRAFNNQEHEEQRFDNVNSAMTKLNIFLNRVMSVASPLMTFLMSFVSVSIIWIGANQIDSGAMQIGDMMAFLQYATHVLMSFMFVAVIFIMIPRSAVSANRIFEVLETKPKIRDPEDPIHLPAGNHSLVFDHVSFRYPKAEQNVLEDICFTADPGETVAIIGSTGSGKSTLVNLIPRFFDVHEGTVRFGDVDIRDVTQKELRERIGYIPQKGILFSGTIESNLRYADEDASGAMIRRALEVSQSAEFVDRMEDGIRSPVAEGGTNFSGGQKQRLSIARALTKHSDIYIFDDTFSALDYKTDASLPSALAAMIEETRSTLIIVAQRISTIRNADKIIVLDNGRTAGIGTHAELMKNCPVYQEIAYSQLSEEELAYE
ncbi:MAG: ABC transporter ATP-binding protein/permease [Solobacterium sp.]|nr:ABC transporter ATP-binding protein/permease [Solobacterium sp.]